MRAMVSKKFGSPLVPETVPTPSPGPGQVRIRTLASAVSAGDWLMTQGEPWVMRPVFAREMGPGPAIPGLDVAGVIDAVGEGVEGWSVGDRVIGELPRAWAEHVIADPARLARIPDGVDPLAAAALPVSAITALQGLRDTAALRAGERVLVVGASGGVGHFTVQIAKALGAEVTGVCRAAKADMVRGCGADEVIDYTRERFTDQRGRWDVVFDLVASEPLSACLETLRPGGRYVSSAGRIGGPVLGPLPRMLAVGLSSFVDRRVKIHTVSPSADDLAQLLAWVADGTLRPHVETVLPLESAAEALRLVGEGRARGKVGLRCA